MTRNALNSNPNQRSQRHKFGCHSLNSLKTNRLDCKWLVVSSLPTGKRLEVASSPHLRFSLGKGESVSRSVVRDPVTLRTVAGQAAWSMEFQARILEWVAIPFAEGWGSPTSQADSSPPEPPGQPLQPGKQRPDVLSHISASRPSLYHSWTRSPRRCVLNAFPSTWLSDLYMETLWGFCQFSEKVRTGLGLTTIRDSVKSTLQITNDKFTILPSIWPFYYYFPYLFLIGRNLTGNYS